MLTNTLLKRSTFSPSEISFCTHKSTVFKFIQFQVSNNELYLITNKTLQEILAEFKHSKA